MSAHISQLSHKDIDSCYVFPVEQEMPKQDQIKMIVPD